MTRLGGWPSVVRVLHIHSGNLFGGIEVVLREVAATARLEPGLEHEFALSFEGELARGLRAAGGRVHELGAVRLRFPWSVARGRRTLDALLGREPFDACICHSPWSLAVFGPAVRRRARPLCLWLHHAVTRAHWLDRRAVRTRPDLLICNSQFTGRAAAREFPGVPAGVVYCPLRPRLPDDRETARRAVRAAWQTPEAAVVIVLAARLEAGKGQERLLEALGRLRDVDGWVCWLAGGPQRAAEAGYFADLKRLAARLGLAERVAFLGHVHDVPALLAAADIHCQPNLAPDSFGIAFIEALDAGLPVVTADMGGASEILDPSCGILVPPGDIEALADALRALIRDRDLRSRLSSAGPRRARALTDPATQLAQLGAVLRSTLHAGDRGNHSASPSLSIT